MILNNSERALQIVRACLDQGEVRYLVGQRATHETAQVASELARAGVLYLTHRKSHTNGDMTVAYQLSHNWQLFLQQQGVTR